MVRSVFVKATAVGYEVRDNRKRGELYTASIQDGGADGLRVRIDRAGVPVRYGIVRGKDAAAAYEIVLGCGLRIYDSKGCVRDEYCNDSGRPTPSMVVFG